MINQELNINPNIIYAENILSKKDSKVIGHIHLMLYDNNPKSIPHLEYEIKEIEYYNKKIMSKVLPSFLKKCKKKGHTQIIALTYGDNIASIKLLEKNNFVRFKQDGKLFTYITDLNHKKAKIQKTVDQFFKL